jgi:hypothetical protein
VSARKFADGDRVIVSQTVDDSDKQYSGKIGTVTSLSHRNRDMDVYYVALDDRAAEGYELAFYDQDLLPYDGLEALREELAQAEAKVVSLKEAIKLKERNAAELPVASVVSYKDTYGPAAMTKQSDDIWLNIFPTQHGNANTEYLSDYKVTQLLINNASAVVRKP